MKSFNNYFKKQLNEMGYMILQQPITMQIGHEEQPIEIKMFDMRYEDYPKDSEFNSLSQWSPVVGKIPGTNRSYLVWDGTDAKISKLYPKDLEELLSQQKKIGNKTINYVMLPNNWFQYAVPVN